MLNAHIKHISTYLPEKVVSNQDLIDIFPSLTEEEIFKKTGIKKRHIAAKGEIGSDLGFQAAEKLFQETGVSRDEFDFLILCTEALDNIAPASSCGLHHRLGLKKNAGCIDLPYGCTGYVYGLSIAQSFIKSGLAKNVLFIAAENTSIVTHPADKELRMIFGDAGSATWLTAAEPFKGIQNFIFGTDGEGIKHLDVKGASYRQPVTDEWIEKYKDADGMRFGKMEMNGAEIFLFTLREVPPLIAQTLEKNELEIDQIDLFLFHQPNGYLLEALRKKLQIPQEKYFVYIEDTGNTASVTIPIAWQEAQKKGVIKKDMTILVAAFGIGLSWIATVIKT